MSITRADGLAMALDEFLRQSPDLEAAAVVSADGLPMASALPPHVEEDRLGAMAAAILSLGDRASETLGRGKLQQVFVEGSSGYVFLMAAGSAVLCAITGHSAKIGLILYEMHRAAATVARLLETQAPDVSQEFAPQAQSVTGF
ncbi:MAG: roadblock/LC7 domain-containing protein [Actinomycetota bacterium]|nr:roadblock/LC7 domain-containing protein [Actinomycetota bacterium]